MSEEIKHEKCARCKTWRLPSMFLNEVGRKLKTCEKCRVKQRNYTANSKCNNQCLECPFQAGCNSSLQIHIQSVHSNTQNYHCPECYKSFGTKGILQKHIKTHINAKVKGVYDDVSKNRYDVKVIELKRKKFYYNKISKEEAYNNALEYITRRSKKNIKEKMKQVMLQLQKIICIHGKVRDNCVPCDGANICICGKVFDNCSSCNKK